MLTEIHYGVIDKLLRLVNLSVIVTNNEENMSKSNECIDRPYLSIDELIKFSKENTQLVRQIGSVDNPGALRSIVVKSTYLIYEILEKIKILGISSDKTNDSVDNLDMKLSSLEEILDSKVGSLTKDLTLTNTKVDNLNFAIDLILEEILELREDMRDILLVSTYEEEESFLPLVGEILDNPETFSLEG